ncbi:unnamed protein product [Trichogramma brassicae]|uniref:Uncharacterized protein n=1 Tax=Trichogramma brassicae TaxID=86971 RepID=A0A6H5IR33_9HYME|nr:unnamed protein product [Trichogramma brassicae]
MVAARAAARRAAASRSSQQHTEAVASAVGVRWRPATERVRAEEEESEREQTAPCVSVWDQNVVCPIRGAANLRSLTSLEPNAPCRCRGFLILNLAPVWHLSILSETRRNASAMLRTRLDSWNVYTYRARPAISMMNSSCSDLSIQSSIWWSICISYIYIYTLDHFSRRPINYADEREYNDARDDSISE